MKYDYMNFMIDTEQEHNNGVYLMSNGTDNYIGKAHRDRGFRQRYASYVHNKANGEIVCKGDKLFQQDNSSAMYDLYSTEHRFTDECRPIEDYLIQIYNYIHKDKPLINADVKNKHITIWDIEPYLNVDHELNIQMLCNLGLMEQVQ